MGFDHWNEALIRALIKPLTAANESNTLINQAHLNCLRIDGRFADELGPLETVLGDQWSVLASLENTNARKYVPHPNATAIAQSGLDWFSNCVDDAVRCKILTRRVAMDPVNDNGLPLTLSMRLEENDIPYADYIKLIGRAAPESNLSTNNRLEQYLWALPVADAVEVVMAILLPKQQQAMDALINQGRLRVVDPLGLGNVCTMTGAGALIQLESKSGIIDVLSLAHEVGHALDFEQRWRKGDYWPADIVESEAVAMAMEFRFDGYAAHRERFYGPWHIALHQFELGLYNMPIIAPVELDELWQRCMSCFNAQPGDWRHIQHFYTSPFYLVCYPLALMSLGRGI